MDGVARMTMSTRPAPRENVVATPATNRARAILPPQIILVGASTGGPQALTKLVCGLEPVAARLPICVTLHMPAELMQVIATHIARACGIRTSVVVAPCPLEPGVVHFAPGNRHLDFRRVHSRAVEINLRNGTPGDFCKPAVDVMFSTAAACFGNRVLGVVLSGMGKDGLAGARAIVAAGGEVIVQDKSSSAVWGMPGAVAKADLAAAVLPPSAIAEHIVRRLDSPGRVR